MIVRTPGIDTREATGRENVAIIVTTIGTSRSVNLGLAAYGHTGLPGARCKGKGKRRALDMNLTPEQARELAAKLLEEADKISVSPSEDL